MHKAVRARTPTRWQRLFDLRRIKDRRVAEQG